MIKVTRQVSGKKDFVAYVQCYRKAGRMRCLLDHQRASVGWYSLASIPGNGDQIGTALGQYHQSVKRDSSSFFLASQEAPVLLSLHLGLADATPDYFRYIVLDLSGSIAHCRHATINIKLDSAHFPREKETTAALIGGAPEPRPWDASSRQNWSGGLVRTPEQNLDWLKSARV